MRSFIATSFFATKKCLKEGKKVLVPWWWVVALLPSLARLVQQEGA